jgi:mannose-6-phosphate isomerase-like protein (cupin superfamily)
MITIEEFENFLLTNFPYEQKIISIIDDFGHQIVMENLGQLHSNYGKTIKVESFEKYNKEIYHYCELLKKKYSHDGPVTCHVFKSFKNSKSFPMHEDLDDVFIFVIDGEKTFEFENDKNQTLKKNESIFIKSGKKHKALNEKESLILSFGIEKFYKDKI